MGECLAKNMINEANFSKLFSNSSQVMLKLGRNLCEIKTKLMTSFLIQKYDVIIDILMLRHLRSGKSSLFLCFWKD